MKTKKIIISILVLVVLLAGGIGLGFYINKKNATATAVVTLSSDGGASASQSSGNTLVSAEKNGASNTTNAEVQLVLNANNKVISVNYLNENANKIYANIDVKGKSVDEASAEFTLALIKSGNAISLSGTAGSENSCILSLEINCDSTAQADKIKSSVTAKVDSTFDANGIYGAVKSKVSAQVTELYDKYKDIADSLYLQSYDFVNKTETQVLAMINERSQELTDCVASEVALLQNYYNSVAITITSNLITPLEARLDELSKSATLTDAQKEQIKEIKSNIEQYAKSIKEKVEAKIEELKESSKTIIAQFKLDINTTINNVKDTYKAYLQAFYDDKDATISAIKQWRDTVENN